MITTVTLHPNEHTQIKRHDFTLDDRSTCGVSLDNASIIVSDEATANRIANAFYGAAIMLRAAADATADNGDAARVAPACASTGRAEAAAPPASTNGEVPHG